MQINLSTRGNVEPFHAMDVLAEANRLRSEGRSIISMAVGQPAAPAPQIVRDSAAAALVDGRISYTDALGLRIIRRAISEHYRDHYAVDVAPERICITTGSSAGFNLAFLSLFDVGDRVAISEPGYPAYRNILRALGLEVVEIPLDGASNLTAAALETAHRVKPLRGVLFASPANPTGANIAQDELKAILELCEKENIAPISDEIYHRLSYESEDVTALGFSARVTVINSFSKYYCMTGWRIGWMVLPDPLVRTVERIQQSLYISAPELSQIAASKAFEASRELDIIREGYIKNRALLSHNLARLRLPLITPMDGAFYAYCDISAHANDSMSFAKRMLHEAGVAATPGIDFDTREGHRSMRFSYAGSFEDMQEALERLAGWIG
ncbi:pyridoxal phosphate-dependent aminotransferase [Limoniibacter endophyticus]|uniref:aspartate transaminase n=1 Tax=Limoniibacter endophyticus TaxID=1565040 RepID=A0A8J3GGN0_9HYPH|nr:aminotransferase class I/II-fold pyridoxal phosphate-dependent enzyme [Limoniibacter endophyticus]GHC61109.1 1-aminocyclopropane-1-carboxylate deaminase [Limoniibacter endophyticus]